MDDNYKYKINLVALHITYSCSHRCPFCYVATNDFVQKKPPPSLNKLKAVVDAIHRAEVKEITFLGGDPASYRHVVDLAKYVSSRDIKVTILSNTLSFPYASIEEAAKYIQSFETTIHHSNPEEHDKFCKSKGAYRKVIDNLRTCSNFGRKTGIAINVTPVTADKIFSIVKSIIVDEKINLNYIIIQRIIPMGRASSSTDFTISKKQAELALHEIDLVHKEFGVEIAVEDPFPLCIMPEHLRKYLSYCEWGFTRAAINSEGDLSRCGADPRYRLGNILKTPLLELWNNSPILKSFRRREYLPGRCHVCRDLDQCGGGCSLSCQIDADHGVDYLYLDDEKIDAEIHGEISFDHARENELSSILLIEWSNFAGYGHIFSVESLKKWYSFNPKMFYVIRDSRNWVLGYGVLVPIKKSLFKSITSGKYSSLTEFPSSEVLNKDDSIYYHCEVVATVPPRTSLRSGPFLIKSLGQELIKHARYVTTSPITDIGIRLCRYFGFKQVAEQKYNGNAYPIYLLTLDPEIFGQKLKRF